MNVKVFVFVYLLFSVCFLPQGHATGEIRDSKLALQELIDGNKRHMEDLHANPNRAQEHRDTISPKQNPFAVVLGCSDSRVAPEIIFDQGLGDLFVVRVAGNVIGPIELSSIEYAVDVLKVPLIMVLGHENCGAIKAVLDHQSQDIEPIAVKIEAAIKKYAKGKNVTVDEAVKANVKAVVDNLKEVPVLKRYLDEKKLNVVGGYYELNTGMVSGSWNEDSKKS